MLVTVLGMTVFLEPIIKVLLSVSIMALQLFRESYTGLPLSTFIEDKPVHPLKTPNTKYVKDSGMVN